MVINYDFPLTSEAYVHRIGRTGRAGAEGRAITFYTVDDESNLDHVLRVIRKSKSSVIPKEALLKRRKKKVSSSTPRQSASSVRPMKRRPIGYLDVVNKAKKIRT